MSELGLGKIVSAFTVYKFIKLFSTPYKSFPSYKLGITDDKGNFLKKSTELKTPEEKEAANVLVRLVLNLRKLTDKIPDPAVKSRLKTFLGTLQLIAEDVDLMGGDGETVVQEIKEYLITQNINLDEMTEEIEANG